jgi:hypothetical protein
MVLIAAAENEACIPISGEAEGIGHANPEDIMSALPPADQTVDLAA